MLNPDLFEELLATYPAEKRELARQVYQRFAEGDSTQFFTQLFILLDVYAHYVGRVPQAVIEANQNAHAGLLKVREEIGLVAQMIEKRNVNIANHAERTDQLCQDAIAACNDTSDKVETLVKNVGAQVNTQAIVENVRTLLNKGIQAEIISPFLKQSRELGEKVLPVLENINKASTEAHTLWMKHIWKTAWAGSFLFTFTLLVMATLGIHKLFEHYAEQKAAEQVAAVTAVMDFNQDAFRQLAIAGVAVNVMRTSNTNGTIYPGGFALVIKNADAAELRPDDDGQSGFIFFSSNQTERRIQRLNREVEKLSREGTNELR
ncbi:hypothetical protein GC207_10235 [bacterium]|nr:hypothetical protein [bacterium]